jgi:hypothetical protein
MTASENFSLVGKSTLPTVERAAEENHGRCGESSCLCACDIPDFAACLCEELSLNSVPIIFHPCSLNTEQSSAIASEIKS